MHENTQDWSLFLNLVDRGRSRFKKGGDDQDIACRNEKALIRCRHNGDLFTCPFSVFGSQPIDAPF
jgi:hypothetical protein